MRYFSMFSGVGGFELGINRAFSIWDGATTLTEPETSKQGLESATKGKSNNRARTSNVSRGNAREILCIGYSEIDKYAIQTYQHNFKGHKNYGDATLINERELPDFDLLVGGFPCQAFSVAGKRHGFNDTRGTLFFDIARILSHKRPRHLVLENVKGLLSHDSGKTFQTILGVLTDLGYLVEWQVLNAKDFGVPQNRERVFIVGHLGNECGHQVFPIEEANETHLKEPPTIIGSSQRHAKVSIDGIVPTLSQAMGQGGGQTPMVMPVLTPDRLKKRQNGRRFKNSGEPSFTLNTQDRHGVAVDLTRRAESNHRVRKDGRAGTLDANYYKGLANQERPGVKEGLHIRRLTPLECERLMSWPDNWTIGSDTQRYKQCGNGVVSNCVQAVIERIYL